MSQSSSIFKLEIWWKSNLLGLYCWNYDVDSFRYFVSFCFHFSNILPIEIQTKMFNAKWFYTVLLTASKELITFIHLSYVECFTLVGCQGPTKLLSRTSTFWETSLLMVNDSKQPWRCQGALLRPGLHPWEVRGKFLGVWWQFPKDKTGHFWHWQEANPWDLAPFIMVIVHPWTSA